MFELMLVREVAQTDVFISYSTGSQARRLRRWGVKLFSFSGISRIALYLRLAGAIYGVGSRNAKAIGFV